MGAHGKDVHLLVTPGVQLGTEPRSGVIAFRTRDQLLDWLYTAAVEQHIGDFDKDYAVEKDNAADRRRAGAEWAAKIGGGQWHVVSQDFAFISLDAAMVPSQEIYSIDDDLVADLTEAATVPAP